MKDIKVTSIRTYLPVIPPVFRISDKPPAIKIVGERFLEAKYVYLNEIQVDNFAIVSNKEIIAQIPELIKNQPITKVTVAAEAFKVQEENLIYFDLGSTYRSISGIQKLVQHFVKLLLQAPGTNIFNAFQGGGLLSMIGQQTITNGRSVVADVIDSINRTKTDIISIQNKNKRIPLEERLLDVSINNIYIGEDKVSLYVNLTLTSMSGAAAPINFGL